MNWRSPSFCRGGSGGPSGSPTLTQLVRRWDVGLSTCPWPLSLPPREVSEVCGGVINSPLPGREEGSSGKWSASLVTATCSCGAQVLLPMCGERVRGVAGGRAAVWAQGKGRGRKTLALVARTTQTPQYVRAGRARIVRRWLRTVVLSLRSPRCRAGFGGRCGGEDAEARWSSLPGTYPSLRRKGGQS